MLFHFDGFAGEEEINLKVPPSPETDKNNLKEFKLIETSCKEKYDYKIIDIFGTTVRDGSGSSLNEIKDSFTNEMKLPGLYIVQLLKKGSVIYQEKIISGY